MNNKLLTIDLPTYFAIKKEVADYLSSQEVKKESDEYNNLKPCVLKAVEYLAQIVYKNSCLIEPKISSDLIELVRNDFTHLESFEERLKSISGIKRKIIADKADYANYSLAANKIRDSIRYTIIIPDDFYTMKIEEYLDRLEEMGYQVVEFKNNWNKPLYQGVNVKITKEGIKKVFEIQFHTPFGYHIKEVHTRDLYQVARNQNAPEELVEKANKLREMLQKIVDVPKDILDYQYQSKIKGGKHAK